MVELGLDDLVDYQSIRLSEQQSSGDMYLFDLPEKITFFHKVFVVKLGV